jgi:putative endopeptidase
MKQLKKVVSALLAVLMVSAAVPGALAAKPAYATRGEVADMLLHAADDYNPSVKRTDIIKGYPDGKLHEESAVTRAEALVMLQRAFGKLPDPKGDNARSGYGASNFTDVPAWAKKELANVFSAGIVAGTSATTFAPDEYVTAHQMQLFIQRVYALEGTNLKDDFYAAVNKTALDNSVIVPGYGGSGSFVDLTVKVDKDVAALVRETAVSPKTDSEKKIAALYNNILDTDARNKAGVTPIKPYLDALTAAKSAKDVMAVNLKAYRELGAPLLMGFGLTIDAKDSTVYDVALMPVSTALGQAGYAGATAEQKQAYLTYLSTLLKLVGQTGDTENAARAIWNAEAAIADKSLPTQDQGDAEKTYNLYSMEQLQAIYPGVDLTALLNATNLKLGEKDKIVVGDVGEMKAGAVLFNDAHLELLKNMSRVSLAGTYGSCLNQEFAQAGKKFAEEYEGTTGSLSAEDSAAQVVQGTLSDYLGEAYVSRHFTAKAKADVETMVRGFLGIYKERIGKLTWMSDATKAKAIHKLDTMKIKIGYPDTWDTYLDGAKILPASEGGSYFANIVAIAQAGEATNAQAQKEGPSKDDFGMPAYTVNAQYDPTSNSIEFPAGILQPPFYDVNASYEKNLGGIGYVIAHEITHAFDNNGAKYDENGNVTDWWTAADYAAFQKLCGKVVTMYDGKEVAPGITCNGELTLSENIADLGAMACITELESRQTKPDYAEMYKAAAQVWCSSYPRTLRAVIAQSDVHAPDKLRGSLVMQQFPEFYEAFGIKEGDGMWIAPQNRVSIW